MTLSDTINKFRRRMKDSEDPGAVPMGVLTLDEMWSVIEAAEAVARAKDGALPTSGCSHPGCQCASCKIILLREQLKGAMEAAEEEGTLRVTLAGLLDDVAGALKGPPGPLALHGWSDLPTLVASLRRAAQGAVRAMVMMRLDSKDAGYRKALGDAEGELYKALESARAPGPG